MYTTLVLSAANMHGIMYVGAFRYLLEHDQHNNIHTIIGSSSGALFGFMLALGLTYEQMVVVVENVFCNIGIPCISLTKMIFAWSGLGILSSAWKIEYIRLLIKKRFQRTDINFSDFAALTGKNLVIAGSNITTQKAEYFSADTTPTMSLIEALNISTCIPFVFRPLVYKDNLYVDGGLYSYLPTDAVTDSASNTLVMHCPCPATTNKQHPKNLYQFMRDIIMSLIFLKCSNDTTKFPTSIPFTSNENSTTVDSLTFKQKIITFPKEHVEKLLEEGYAHMRAYFETHAADV